MAAPQGLVSDHSLRAAQVPAPPELVEGPCRSGPAGSERVRAEDAENAKGLRPCARPCREGEPTRLRQAQPERGLWCGGLGKRRSPYRHPGAGRGLVRTKTRRTAARFCLQGWAPACAGVTVKRSISLRPPRSLREPRVYPPPVLPGTNLPKTLPMLIAHEFFCPQSGASRQNLRHAARLRGFWAVGRSGQGVNCVNFAGTGCPC